MKDILQQSDYHYFAFISYKREDVKYARWLQKELETYKLPSIIRKEHPLLPTRLAPVFRDVTDLGAGPLKENLKDELRASKFLIVVCSPESAKSDWVGEEVTDFVGFGRADRIIPFIISGRPNSDDETECFHPALKNIGGELLGINVQEIGKSRALIKTVAKLLDLRFDELWNREKRRQQKKRIIKWTAVSILLAGIVAFGAYTYPRERYYTDISEFSDEWKSRGLNEVSKEDIRHMNKHYCFTTSMGKLQYIQERNSARCAAGDLIVYDDTRLYGSNVSYNEIYQYNELGALEQVLSASSKDNTRFDIKDGNYISNAKGMLDMDVPTDIRRIVVFRDVNGFANKLMYKRHNGDDSIPGISQNGVHGEEYELDSLGHITEVHYLLEDGVTRCADKYGIYKQALSYDEAGNLVSCGTYDASGALLNDRFGIAVYRFSYDSYHNITRLCFYDRSNQPTPNQSGSYGCVNVYNDRGFQTGQTFLGPDSSPAPCDGGYASVRRTFYVTGKIKTETFCDAEGHPVIIKNETYSSASYTYDNHCWVTSIEFFDTDSSRCRCNNGFSKAVFSHDQYGNVSETLYYGEDDLPCLNSLGFHRETVLRDAQRLEVTVCHYDADGNLSKDTRGVAQERVKLDNAGRDILHEYFDSEGNPVEDISGIHSVRLEYNSRGGRVRIRNCGLDGAPRNDENGISVTEYEYDIAGEMAGETHYDEKGDKLR